jgi:hypothetical protein
VTDFRTLQPAPNAPADIQYRHRLSPAADLVHLILVRMNDVAVRLGLPERPAGRQRAGRAAAAVPPTTPYPVTIKGIFSTNSDPVNGTPTVVLALSGS